LLNMGDRIIFAGHQEEVERFFSALDIFFFTSYASEGVPQGLVQAVATGVSLVVCKLPAVLETLQGIDGVVAIDHGNVAEAVDALISTAGHCEREADRIRTNRELLSTRYGIENMIDKLETLYREYNIV